MRSLPSSHPFKVAAFCMFMHYLGLVTVISTFVWFMIQPNQLAMKVVLGGIGFSAVTWPMAFFKRRSARCPLCLGTPLINSGALPHSRALRTYPLNHGVTATLSILATRSFRCMYCGSDFDLRKTPSNRREKPDGGYSG